MDTKTLESARLALASNVNRPLLEYFEARYQDHLASLVSCNGETFRQYQGRALECAEIIKLIKQVK